MASHPDPYLACEHARTCSAASRADELIYRITHDFRTPIRALTTIPHWVIEDLEAGGAEVAPPIRKHLDMIHRQAAHLDRMMLELREFSRIGRLSDPNSDVDIAAMAAEIATEIQLPDSFTIETDLEVGKIRGPANDIRRLFRALIANAVMHHDRDAGSIEITTRAGPSGLRISVADDGPGVPEEAREQVFEMLTTLRRVEATRVDMETF